MWIRVFIACLVTLSGFVSAEETTAYNRINISASVSGELANDRMIVKLMLSAAGESSSAAADQVNNDMQWALEKLSLQPDIKGRTLNYRTFPTYKEQSITGWQVEQGLRLESSEMNLLAAVTGELQSKLKVTAMEYEASPEKQRAKENDLIRAAIDAFEERALVVANSLGAQSYQIVSLRIDSQDRHQGFPAMEAMTRSAIQSAPAPANVQAGNQTISVYVRGEIELVKH